MRHCKAIAARTANSTALRLSTGKAPGRPTHTGHTLLFGGSPKRVEHEQKIFDAVSNCTWTSSPITGSYLASRFSDTTVVVAISKDYRSPVRADAFVRPARRRLGGHREPQLFWTRRHGRAQILFHRNFKIHQLCAFGVLHAGQIEARARQGIRDVLDIEKQKTTHAGVPFH